MTLHPGSHFLEEDWQGRVTFLGAQVCGETFCSRSRMGSLWGEGPGYLKLFTQQSPTLEISTLGADP